MRACAQRASWSRSARARSEAAEINAGFLLRVARGPAAVPSQACDLARWPDRHRVGREPWITGEAARADGHRLRAIHDAILVGAGTVAADDPELTCRLPGLAAYSPVRIVLDSQGAPAATSKLATTARARRRCWLLCTRRAPAAARAALQRARASRSSRSRPTPTAASTLRRPRATRRARPDARAGRRRRRGRGGLPEGRPGRSAQPVYRGGLVLGGDSRSAVGALALERLDFAPRFRLVSSRVVGRRHAGNLARGGLKYEHVHRHRHRHRRDHRRHARRPGRRPPLRGRAPATT